MTVQRRESRTRTRSDSFRNQDTGTFTIANGVLLLVLLILPAIALYRVSRRWDLRLFGAGWLIFGLVTYFWYARDKKSAQLGRWRTPESTLHLLEFLGGWPAAFVAQRTLRHKISKRAYQSTFALIIFVHQFVAYDFLAEWRVTRGAIQVVQRLSTPPR